MEDKQMSLQQTMLPDGTNLHNREALGPIRDEIIASWRRSLFSGLRPDELHVPYRGDVEMGSHLEHVARPVLSQVARELDGTGTSVVLATAEGCVIDRWVPDGSLTDELDAVSLAPGYLYGEEHVGTSGIGLAIEYRRPVFVKGHEHFAEALTRIACSAAPIVDPRTRRVIGVVSFASGASTGSPLMLPMAARAAGEIANRLLDEARTSEHVLFDHYLRAANRTNRPVVALNAGTMITNEAASRLLQASDQAVLRELASQALASRRLVMPTVTLAAGDLVSAHCQPVYDGEDLIGITVQLSSSSETPTRSARTRPARDLPGLVGGSDLWRAVCSRARQAAQGAGVVQIVGEPGVGKLAVATALLESIDGSSVRVHDAADVRVNPVLWLAEFDQLVDDGSVRVVLRHAHLLDDSLSYHVGTRLEDISSDGPARVAVTGDVADGAEAPDWALRFYLAETVTVPPLRRRREDIPALFCALASQPRDGDKPSPELAPDALRTLLAYPWPGNVRQLGVVASHALFSAADRMVRLADLPAWLHGTHPRRPLSPREQLEFDAIVAALQATEGNRVHAAHRLGMARSTLYRKLDAYGIEPDELTGIFLPSPEVLSERAIGELQEGVA